MNSSRVQALHWHGIENLVSMLKLNQSAMNMSALPAGMPDEMLYSLITRYHIHTCNDYIGQTLQQLFGCPRGNILFSQVLKRDREDWTKFESLTGWSFESIITQFTQYYYEALFNSSYGAGDMSRFGSGIVIPDIVDYGKGRKLQKKLFLRDGVSLRLCPQCVRDDITKFNFPYWHRCHQLPGVRACHIHNSWLLTTCHVCETPFCSHKDVEIPTTDCRCGAASTADSLIVKPYSIEAASHYARLSADPLLSQSFPFAPHIIGRFYQSEARKRYDGESISSLKFITAQRIIDTYSIELISEISGKPCNLASISRWIHELFAGRHQPTYRHLLLIGSLFPDFGTFKCSYHEFFALNEKEKWASPVHKPLLNEQSPQKAKLTITEARKMLRIMITQDKELTRSVLANKNNRLYQFIRMNDIDWFRKMLPTKTIRRDGSSAEPGRVSTVEGDRVLLLKLLGDNPELNARELSKSGNNRLYKRLLLRDKEWLNQTLNGHHQTPSVIIDNDAMRAEKVPQAIQKILDLPGRPVKVTIKEIMKVMGEPRDALVGVNSINTKELVYKRIETSEAYFSRLYDWAIAAISNEGGKIHPNSIQSKIGCWSSRKELQALLRKKILDHFNAQQYL
ncbi:MAG: TniQ family protein [Burkholderiales bacterium]